MAIIINGRNANVPIKRPTTCLKKGTEITRFTHQDRIINGQLVAGHQEKYDRVETEVGGRMVWFNADGYMYTYGRINTTDNPSGSYLYIRGLSDGGDGVLTRISDGNPSIYVYCRASGVEVVYSGDSDVSIVSIDNTILVSGIYMCWYVEGGKSILEVRDRNGLRISSKFYLPADIIVPIVRIGASTGGGNKGSFKLAEFYTSTSFDPSSMEYYTKNYPHEYMIMAPNLDYPVNTDSIYKNTYTVARPQYISHKDGNRHYDEYGYNDDGGSLVVFGTDSTVIEDTSAIPAGTLKSTIRLQFNFIIYNDLDSVNDNIYLFSLGSAYTTNTSALFLSARLYRTSTGTIFSIIVNNPTGSPYTVDIPITATHIGKTNSVWVYYTTAAVYVRLNSTTYRLTQPAGQDSTWGGVPLRFGPIGTSPGGIPYFGIGSVKLTLPDGTVKQYVMDNNQVTAKHFDNNLVVPTTGISYRREKLAYPTPLPINNYPKDAVGNKLEILPRIGVSDVVEGFVEAGDGVSFYRDTTVTAGSNVGAIEVSFVYVTSANLEVITGASMSDGTHYRVYVEAGVLKTDIDNLVIDTSTTLIDNTRYDIRVVHNSTDVVVSVNNNITNTVTGRVVGTRDKPLYIHANNNAGNATGFSTQKVIAVTLYDAAGEVTDSWRATNMGYNMARAGSTAKYYGGTPTISKHTLGDKSKQDTGYNISNHIVYNHTRDKGTLVATNCVSMGNVGGWEKIKVTGGTGMYVDMHNTSIELYQQLTGATIVVEFEAYGTAQAIGDTTIPLILNSPSSESNTAITVSTTATVFKHVVVGTTDSSEIVPRIYIPDGANGFVYIRNYRVGVQYSYQNAYIIPGSLVEYGKGLYGERVNHIGRNAVTADVIDYAAEDYTVNIDTSSMVGKSIDIDVYTYYGSSPYVDNLTKTTTDGWGNCGAESDIKYTGDIDVSHVVNAVGTKTMVGLSTVNTNDSYDTIDYAIYTDVSTIRVYESGAHKGEYGTYAIGDVLHVKRIGDTVTYWKNDTLLYTSTSTTTDVLLVDVAIFIQNATLSDLKVNGNPVNLININGGYGTRSGYFLEYNDGTNQEVYTYSNNSLHMPTLVNGTIENQSIIKPYVDNLTKTAADGWGNCGAESDIKYTGDIDVSHVVTAVSNRTMVGLSTVNTNDGFNTIDYAIYTGVPTIIVYESGGHKGDYGTYAIGDVLHVKRIGNTVTYWKNDTLLYTSASTTTDDLLVDVAIYIQNATLSDIKVNGNPVNLININGGYGIPNGGTVINPDSGMRRTRFSLTVPTGVNNIQVARSIDGSIRNSDKIAYIGINVDGSLYKEYIPRVDGVYTYDGSGALLGTDTTATISDVSNGYNSNESVSLVQTPIFTDGTTDYVTTVNTSGTFDINSKNIVGTIPPEIGNLTNLQYLYLHANQLTGTIPSELGNLTNLQYLRLYANQLSGPIPPELGNLTNLINLYLHENQLTGSIPSELGNLTNLQNLQLYNNQLTGSIPPELGNLTNLINLRLYTNQLTGSIPPELGNLTNLQVLYLDANQLTGPIPPELGSLTNLLNLHLYGNQLTGSIPPELGNLTNIQYLRLYTNQLTGSIPPELGNLTNVLLLYIHENQLTGSIPPELGNLTSVQYLSLSANQLSGPIPPELGNITSVQVLYLQANQLTGTIPSELGNLTNLQALFLNDNQLTSADDFLIAAASNASDTAWVNTNINLLGNGLTLSTAAQNAVTTLENNGCTVNI